MKRILLSSLFIFSTLHLVLAQTLSVSPNDTFTYSASLINDYDNVELNGTVTNNSNTADTVLWYVSSLNNPVEWEMSVCDINNCYLISTPGGQPFSYVALPHVANLIRFGVTPHCVSGNSTLVVTLWAKSDSAGTVILPKFLTQYTGACVSAIQETPNTTVNIFPAVFHSQLTIACLKPAEIRSIKLLDAAARIMAELKAVNRENMSLETSNWAAGIYFVRIETPDGVFLKKLVKE